MSSLVKLLVGFVATFVVAAVAYSLNRAALLSDLGSRSAEVMAANGIGDGRANWIGENGWTYRRARLSGTADTATRTRTLATVAALEGVHGAVWDDEAVVAPMPIRVAPAGVDCQRDPAATVASNPIVFGDHDARLGPSAEAVVDRLAAQLHTCRDLHFVIAVHSAPDKSPALSLSLSQSRAEAIVEALGRRGLDMRNYEPAGLGATEPKAGHTETDADRVEFIFQPDDTAREGRR